MEIRLNRRFQFEMAHALMGYDGPCRNIHGHSYQLEVMVAGEIISDVGNPKLGMVIDFSVLKEIVNREVINEFDHTLLLNEIVKTEAEAVIEGVGSRVRFVPYQPTCENLLLDIRKRIISCLPPEIRLVRLRLHETANSYAEVLEELNKN